MNKPHTPKPPARYIMVGGFLGAGKSTAVIALARHLKNQNLRVGLITNDQSVGLVDTALMRAAGFNVEEITGGCFCCRFDSLLNAAEKLTAADTPDVFIAEPVGSCTDLLATVSYPLRRIYGNRYTLAPLTVMIDPIRCLHILGLADGKRFTEKVIYVYRKQLEEASILVINKIDLLDSEGRSRLRDALSAHFPRARIIELSARTNENMTPWFDSVMADSLAHAPTMPIDYDRYAEGEAMLGWLNATLQVSADQPFDGETFMMDLAGRMQQILTDIEIAHLKMTLMPDGHDGRVAALNLVRSDYIPELSQSLAERMRSGRLIVNVRAEADPKSLESALKQAISDVTKNRDTMNVAIEHLDRFRPGRPTPTWRMTDADTLTPLAAID